MSIDRIFATYIFCSDHHEGQDSRLYRLMNKIYARYTPRISDNAWQEIQGDKEAVNWSTARRIYLNLCKQHEQKLHSTVSGVHNRI